MKRLLSLIMILCLLIAMPAFSMAELPEGWLGNEDGTPITLKVWGGIQPEYGYNEAIANFNAEYAGRGVQAEYVRYVNNTDGNLQVDTYLLGGDEIDVLVGYGAPNLINRAQSNLILNVTERLAARGFDAAAELGNASMSQYWIDGNQVYGLPSIYSNNRWLLVNVNAFKDAGIEVPYDGWTYAQFLEAAEKLTHGDGWDKVYGMMWAFQQDSAQARGLISSVLGQYGYYTDMDGKASNFDNPIWAEGLQLIKTTMDNGWAFDLATEMADSLTVANTFLEGKAAMSIGIAQLRLLLDVETYPHDFQVAIVPGPVPNETYLTDEYRYHTNYSGTNDLVCVASKTKHPDASFEFMMWYLTGGMAPLSNYGRIPLWKGFDSEKILAAFADKSDVVDLTSLKTYLTLDKSAALTTPKLSAYNQIDTVIVEEIQNALLGQKSVEQALSDAKTRADALIAEAK